MDVENISYFCNNITSFCDNITSIETMNDENFMKKPAVQAIICLHYLVIFILGVFGNCLVCFVVFRNKHMHTVTNYFIANLALADILLCILAVPFTPMYYYMERWVFGSVLCTMLAMAQGMSVYVSTLTLTSIAIDRYFVIIHPFRPKLSLKTCYSIIFGIWVFSISATLPYALFMKQEHINDNYYCEEFWPSEATRRVFSLCTTITQFVIPFVIILYCYVMISVRMNERIRFRPGSRGSRRDESDREKKRRTNRMLIAMVTIFGVCWLPVNIAHLIVDYHAKANSWAYFNFCFFMTHVVAMSSTCYNPFLYAWLNENFRKEFQLVLPCFFKKNHVTGRRSFRRSERTCNGNETQQEVLANPIVMECAVVPEEGNEDAELNNGCKKDHSEGICEEVIQLRAVGEVKQANGEIHDKVQELGLVISNL